MIRFDPTSELNANAETLNPDLLTPPADPELLPVTKDQFWSLVSNSNSNVSFQMVVSLRFLLHMVSSAHRNQCGITLTGNAMAKFYKGFKLTTDVSASIFWDDQDKVINFFKNRLFNNHKRKQGESALAHIKSNFLRLAHTKLAWEAVFRHMDYAQVERVYESAVHKVFDPNLPEFPIFEDPGSPALQNLEAV